jgi:hypothetical protein
MLGGYGSYPDGSFGRDARGEITVRNLED